MASYTTWQDFIAKQEKHQHPVSEEELSTLKKLFSEPSVSVPEIARDLLAPTSEAIQKDLPPVDQFRLWRTITDAVKELTEYNDKLVELVVEFSKAPGPSGAFDRMQQANEYWTEFAFDYTDPPSTDPERPAKRQGWVNLNAFAAKLCLNGLDQTRRSVLSIRTALEKTPWEDEPVAVDEDEMPAFNSPVKYDSPAAYRAHLAELRQIENLNGWVRAAAQWFLINGKGLYELEGVKFGNETPRNATIWDGPKGFSKERFLFWRKRFEWIGTLAQLDKETKEAAKEAAATMKKIEEGN